MGRLCLSALYAGRITNRCSGRGHIKCSAVTRPTDCLAGTQERSSKRYCQGKTMKSSSFTPLRALGILVGSLFVTTAPFTANDKGLLSFDGIGILLGSMALGLVFIVYGIKGNALWVKPSSFHGSPMPLGDLHRPHDKSVQRSVNHKVLDRGR